MKKTAVCFLNPRSDRSAGGRQWGKDVRRSVQLLEKRGMREREVVEREV